MKIDRSTLFKLYYLCLIVVVIAGVAVHFMEAPEAPEAHEGAVAPGDHDEEAHEAPETHEEVTHEAEEEGFWWLQIPLFAAIFAFVGGVVLLALSKLGVYPLIKRKEDYYEEHSFKKGGEQ